jgi:bifunctional non-homologous end joining protein LigD
VRQPPKGEQWLHEPKLDGWRCQAIKVGLKITLYSRHGHDITKRFPTIAAAVAKLPAKSLVLDGELVQSGATGIDFYGLTGKQNRDLTLWAFDLLRLDGKDLRDLPLVERKAQLEMLLKPSRKAGSVHFVPSFDDGQALLLACMERT